jgi:Putative MetA-pathway of phenol degradation
MCKRLLFVCLALAVLHIPDRLHAQFTDPRNYENTPIGVNQIELAYAYARANASIDTSLVISGAEVNLNQGTIGYTRYFGFLHRTAWIEASVPVAGINGSVTGTQIRGSVTGAGDSSYQLAMLLRGGPALNVRQFEGYRPTTSVGVSLTITAPTGVYDPNKVLNLGSGRWSFKPEVAVSHPFGPEQKWVVDVYANAYFFTDNTSYHGQEILRQEPIPGLEGHLSYSLTPKFLVALCSRYSFRGNTFINDLSQNNAQQNFVLGSEVNLSLNDQNLLVVQFGKALVYQNAPALSGVSLKYLYSWGKGYN